jgi:hypothetical protein
MFAVAPATAATGSIEFQKVDVGLSSKGGRPERPVIIVSNKDADGVWRATDAPVRFKLRVHVKLNSRSDVTNIVLGVPGLGTKFGTWSAFSIPARLSAREVIKDPTTHDIPSNQLALPSFLAGKACANANPGAPLTIPTSLDVAVEVSAARGTKHDERRRRIFVRTIPAEVRCMPVLRTVAEPRRTPGAPQRTPGEPKRTLSPYRPLTVELGFARAGNAMGCPAEIRQSIRIVSPGPGTAKVYLLRQDNPGVLGAPIFVDVSTRMPDAKYVGVLRKTLNIASPLKRTYRVLAVNPFGEPVASPWAVLDVKC